MKALKMNDKIIIGRCGEKLKSAFLALREIQSLDLNREREFEKSKEARDQIKAALEYAHQLMKRKRRARKKT